MYVFAISNRNLMRYLGYWWLSICIGQWLIGGDGWAYDIGQGG